MVKITILKDTGKFSQILYNGARGYSLAYNSSNKAVYSVDKSGKVSRVFDYITCNRFPAR